MFGELWPPKTFVHEDRTYEIRSYAKDDGLTVLLRVFCDGQRANDFDYEVSRLSPPQVLAALYEAAQLEITNPPLRQHRELPPEVEIDV